MLTARHPQTLTAFTRRGATVRRAFGHPFKIRIAAGLACKDPRPVATLFVGDRRPPGLRQDRGDNRLREI